MEDAERMKQVEQVDSESLQPSAGEVQTEDIDLSASAPNHMPPLEIGDQPLLVQALQEASDSKNQSERAVNSEMYLLPEKAPGGEEATLVTDLLPRLPISHSLGDMNTAPNNGVDCSVHSARFHAGQMDTTLLHTVPYHHISSLLGDPDAVQSTAQQGDLDEEFPRIQAYAKLEFPGAHFYMNTYRVALGRDLEAIKLAYEWEQDNSQFAQLKRRRTSTSTQESSQSSINTVPEDQRHNGRTVISETGGLLGPDAQESHIHKKPRLSTSKSATPLSPQRSRTGSMDLPNAAMAGQSSVMPSLLDTYNLPQANPEACPLIGIHPLTTGEGCSANHKGISRKHAIIAYNFKKRRFDFTVLGRNGAFVDETYYKAGDVIPLRNRSLIQIGAVPIRFLLPDTSSGEDSAEAADPFSNSPVDPAVTPAFGNNVHKLHHELNVRGLRLEQSTYESSYEYTSSEEDEPRGNQGEAEEAEGTEVGQEGEAEDDEDGIHIGSSRADNSSEPEEVEAKPSPKSARVKQNGKAKANRKQAKKSGARLSAKARSQPEAQSNSGLVLESTAPVAKRKGPGRPPKNGFMSKRELKLLAKEAEEATKATEPSPSGEKAIRAGQDDPLAPPAPTKRKYTKRKPKDPHHQSGQDADGENPEHTNTLSSRQPSAARPKLPKEKKSARPPRSPSPEIDRTTLTREQLARPTISYLHILYDVLSEAPPGGLGLPKIYSAITNKYAYFKFEVTTVGWQSSVRHNLTQHGVFRKTKREGKGWLWALNPDVPLEKEKKRRVSSPPQSTLHASHHPQMMAIPENYQQAPMMHAHNFPPPFPPPAYQEYPQPPMISHPYHYPGVSIPNGHPPHNNNNVYTAFEPPGQIPYPLPGSSPSGTLMGESHQGVRPNGLSLSLLRRVADTSSTYESPYQPKAPMPPPDPPNQQLASAATLVNGFDGAYDHPGPVKPALPPPPAAAETLTTQLNGPSASPAPPTQPLGPASVPALNASLTIPQVIEKFKKNMYNEMKDHKDGEALVDSAINRVLGHQTSSSLPGNEDDPNEKTIMQFFSAMLDDMTKKTNKLQQPPPSQSPSSEPSHSQTQSSQVPVPAAVMSSISQQQQQPQQQSSGTEQQAKPASES